jgi:hypothetical protein
MSCFSHGTLAALHRPMIEPKHDPEHRDECRYAEEQRVKLEAELEQAQQDNGLIRLALRAELDCGCGDVFGCECGAREAAEAILKSTPAKLARLAMAAPQMVALLERAVNYLEKVGATRYCPELYNETGQVLKEIDR